VGGRKNSGISEHLKSFSEEKKIQIIKRKGFLKKTERKRGGCKYSKTKKEKGRQKKQKVHVQKEKTGRRRFKFAPERKL